MVTSAQIARGIGAWVDAEMLPMTTGATKYGASVAAAMGAKWMEGKLEKIRNMETTKELGIAVGDGFDLDALKTVMLEQFPADGLRIEAEKLNNMIAKFLGKWGAILNIQLQGAVTFHRSDVEKLFGYIMGG